MKILGVLLTILTLSTAPLHGLTHSKLSVHSGPNEGDATIGLVTVGQPRVIKLLDSFGNAERYKSLAPGLVVIGRVYLPYQPQNGDPKEVIIVACRKRTITKVARYFMMYCT